MAEENTQHIEPITEKLDEKIAKLNSNRVFKSVTPIGTVDWYIKWIASAFVIAAVCAAVWKRFLRFTMLC